MKKNRKIPNSEFSILSSKFSIILVAILAGIPFVLGRYFEFNFPDPYDSAANVYSAQHILNGAKIGVDENPSARSRNIAGQYARSAAVWVQRIRAEADSDHYAGGRIYPDVCRDEENFRQIAGGCRGNRRCDLYVIAAHRQVRQRQRAVYDSVYGDGGKLADYAAIGREMVAWFSGRRRSPRGRTLFKETGVSAIGAMGLFVIVQPIFKHRTWKQTGIDIMLLLAGAAASMAPLYIWIIGWHVQMALPFYFVWDAIAGLIPKASARGPAGRQLCLKHKKRNAVF